MPQIRRKAVNAYTDEIDDTNTRAICNFCYDKGIEVKLVPYFMTDGRRDDGFRRCPNCAVIIPRQQTKHKSEIQALGSVKGVMDANFVSVVSKRSISKDDPRNDLKQDIPKLAGKPDRDLEYMVNEGAVILSVTDDFIEEEE